MSMGDPFTAMIVSQLASQGINAGLNALRPDPQTGFAQNDPAAATRQRMMQSQMGAAQMGGQQGVSPPAQGVTPTTGLDLGAFLMALAQRGGTPRG